MPGEPRVPKSRERPWRRPRLRQNAGTEGAAGVWVLHVHGATLPWGFNPERGADPAAEPLGNEGKGKRISRGTRGEPSAAAITWTPSNECSCWGLSPQNLSGSELVSAQQNPRHIQALKAPLAPKQPGAHTRTQPMDPAPDGRCSRCPSHKPVCSRPPCLQGHSPPAWDTHPRMASCPSGSSGSPCPPRLWEEQPRGPGSSRIPDPRRGRRHTLAVLTGKSEPWQSPRWQPAPSGSLSAIKAERASLPPPLWGIFCF